MLKRVPRWPVSDLDTLALRLDDEPPGITLIFDADNTIVPQQVASEEFVTLANHTIDRFEAHPAVNRVIVLSNGAQRGVPRLVARGNKPWTTRHRLGLRRSDRVWVVGDQVLTDGVLAWRLGAPFVQLVISYAESPIQARMRRRGKWLEKLLFTR
jgi:predicted HAD superfamily phosphohydrolase YqeG